MRFLSPITLAALLALSAPGAGYAQPATAQNDARSPFFTLQFAGGSLADYVGAVQQAAGWANVVADPRASEVQIPRCELRNVSVLAAFQAADSMVGHSDGDVALAVGQVTGSGGAPVYTLELHFSKSRNAPPTPDPVHYTVISIREILSPRPGAAALKAEAVLTAIDTAVGLATDGPKATIKYHSDTGLVIVQGTPSQVHLVEEVVSRIREDARSQFGPAPKTETAAKPVASIEERIAEAERELAALREEMSRRKGSPK